jgi:hypothetical protein
VTSRRDEVRRRRRDRRARAAAVLLAIAAGLVAGLLGTHRAWEAEPAPTTTTTVPAPMGSNGTSP